MFIERLTKKDICNYLAGTNKQNGNIQNLVEENIRNFKAKNGKLTFSFNNVNFIATDFNLASSKHSTNENWAEFLYKKFGKEYADAIFEHRQKRKEISIENATKKAGFTAEQRRNFVYEDLIR